MVARTIVILALVVGLRLPFLHQAIQGDDVLYLTAAEHAQIEPLHPNHARYSFMGHMVDLRGHSHPPLNAWILGALLAGFGEIREVPFHLAYTLFSILAALAAWSLARRFCTRPFLATVLFCAVPAFVVNGSSLESDLPFVAFWLCSMALFVRAVDTGSQALLAGSAVAAGLAGLTAYQAVLLTPILGVYLWQHKRDWRVAWFAACAAPLWLAAWQIWERATSGALPASVLAGYLSAYNFEALQNKIRAAAALVVHLGWMVAPVVVVAALGRAEGWRWAAVAAIGAAIYDPNPLFWISFGAGVWLLVRCMRGGFPGWWVLIFFAGAVMVFFVGSARYLLPVAAPAAMLAAEMVRPSAAAAAVAVQLVISLALATVNYEHWDGYRRFAATLTSNFAERRVWINSDLGLRYYLESQGGLPLNVDQPIQTGDIVVSSALANPVAVRTPVAGISDAEIRPRIPLRLIALDGRSAYSVGSQGLLPFEISTGVVDRVRAEIAIEPTLSYVSPQDASQILDGLSADGWMGQEATLLLKVPASATRLEASIFVPPAAPARHVAMLVNGKTLAEQNLPSPGAYTLSAAAPGGASSIVIKLSVDKTFSAPPDLRALGVKVIGVGFR